MQSLAALGHLDFNQPYLCGYNTYSDYARRLGIGKSGIEEIFRRMAFNVLSYNCDDHVKNVIQNWLTYAEKCGINEKRARIIDDVLKNSTK